jgi:protein-disulfide isomerase
VRLVYVQFPMPSLHPGAIRAAEASLEAHRQGKFWPYYDALFAHGGPFDRETLLRIARQQDLDAEALRKALDSGVHRARVEHEMALGEELGVTGTPTFFINGHRHIGALPYERFVTAYNLLLRASRRAEAREAGAAG